VYGLRLAVNETSPLSADGTRLNKVRGGFFKKFYSSEILTSSEALVPIVPIKAS